MPIPELAEMEEWKTFRLTLEPVTEALARLGNPHRAYRHLLVGGTNGKGTVALNLARLLGAKTGLLLSPHVEDVRERITLAGDWLPDTLWREAYDRVRGPLRGLDLSYFEWLLVLAVTMFAMLELEWAVFEVGLGGRLDAANALDPEMSALTNVSLDHQAILGDTVTAIALEKIEIARRERPFVLPSSLKALIPVRERLAAIGCEPVWFEEVPGYAGNMAVLQAAAAEVLDKTAPATLIDLPGRRERFVPAGFLDGAHNPAAWRDLVPWIQAEHGGKVEVLCSLTQGRDPAAFIEILGPIAKGFHVWRAGFYRELPSEAWPATVPRVTEKELCDLARRPLLVCGSLYLVGHFKKWLKSANMGGDANRGTGT